MKEVIFTKKFGIKKKGDKAKYDSILCNRLVRIDKVANYIEGKKK